jgi:serine/threonine protein kinase
MSDTSKEIRRDLKSGKVVFSRYTLEAEVGRGGMGVVWRAKDALLDHHVALKFLPIDTISLSNV